jgi:transcriptional regulator with XRE-family HTH domain
MAQSDIAKELGIDKSVVSRWFHGSTPSAPHQEALASLFSIDPESLFRDPDDDWISRFLRDKSPSDRKRAIQMLEVMFSKTG